MDESIKKDYELSFLVKSEEVARQLPALLGQHKCELIFEGLLKKIALAYKIGKESEAFFGYFHIQAAPEEIKLLEPDLRMNSAVLRFLIITPPLFNKVKPKTSEVARRTPFQPTSKPALAERKAPLPLSNEALERKIEEILQ